MVPPLLEVRDLTRSFYGVRALAGVHLSVAARRITGLIGPNGAGKTTLFNCISGVVPPSSGKVLFEGRDITGWRTDRIASAGLVRTFQIARGFPRLTVYENLLLYGRAQPGERVHAALLRTEAARRREADLVEKAHAIAERLNLVRVLNAPAQSLSGGNLQKFVVGREIEREPRVLIAAQPTWGVDVGAAAQIRQALLDLRDRGVAVLVVSEDLDELLEICDRLAVIAQGRLSAATPVAQTSAEEIGQLMAGIVPAARVAPAVVT